MMNKRLLITAMSAALAVALSGCSALSVGEEEFACTGMPGSVYCHSARDVYEVTNSGIVPSPVKRSDGAYNEDCTDCVRAEELNPDLAVPDDDTHAGVSKTRAQKAAAAAANVEIAEVVDRKTGEIKTIRRKTLELNDDEVINNYVAPRLPSDPVPVRTPAQVMRIWVAPYVDTNGDLVAPGFVYTEIEPRRWIYPDDERAGNPRMIAPLQAAAPYMARKGEKSSSEIKPLK